MDCDWSNVWVRLRRKYRWAQARSYYISAMIPIAIRGPENSISHRSKIMERKKHGGYGGEAEREIRGRNTAKQFLYNHVFSFPRRSLREEAGEFTCALTHMCVAREKEWTLMNGRAIRDSFCLFLSSAPPLSYYELCRAPDSLSTMFLWNLTRTRYRFPPVVNDNQYEARWDFANGT